MVRWWPRAIGMGSLHSRGWSPGQFRKPVRVVTNRGGDEIADIPRLIG